jgi:beta-galactosidase
VRLTADRASIRTDGQDVSFVAVEAADAEGRLQPKADQEVQFSISGPGVIAAVGNGDGKDGAPYHGDRRRLFQGRAQVVVRTSKHSGQIHLTAAIPGLGSGAVTIEAKSAASRLELQ